LRYLQPRDVSFDNLGSLCQDVGSLFAFKLTYGLATAFVKNLMEIARRLIVVHPNFLPNFEAKEPECILEYVGKSSASRFGGP
jgi:hypothetical protein